MGRLTIRQLTLADERAFQAAVAIGDDTTTQLALHWKERMSFRDYVTTLHDMELGRNLPAGLVPSHLLFGFVDGQIVGRVSIRHKLNDFLSKYGGHIGYVTLAPYRGRGYATEMLRQSLKIAGTVGINKALLTCDDNNLASIRTIEKCGGVYIGRVDDPKDGIPKRHYWIDLLKI